MWRAKVPEVFDAAIKVRLVGLDFMELRNAPVALRAMFEAYCFVIWAVLSGLYLWLSVNAVRR